MVTTLWEKSLFAASNPGPYHFDLLDLREKDLGKLPAILEIVRSMDRFDCSFHCFFTLTVARVPCYEMSRAYITGQLLATTCRFFWASTKPSCLEHVEEKSSIDKQSDSIGNQTVEIGLLVRVLKSCFCCRFWSRSCVISVSTDSQKKAEKEKPIDEDLADSTGLMEKLRKRRSTEGVREPDVYGSICGFDFFKRAFAMRILWRRRKHMTLGSQIFFISS